MKRNQHDDYPGPTAFHQAMNCIGSLIFERGRRGDLDFSVSTRRGVRVGDGNVPLDLPLRFFGQLPCGLRYRELNPLFCLLRCAPALKPTEFGRSNMISTPA
jgi:hypothetical protein